MEQMISDVAVRLKELRERADISLQRMADALEVPLNTYRHYEERYKKPFLPMAMTIKVADVLSAHGIDRSEVMTLAAGDGAAEFSHRFGFAEPGSDRLRAAFDSVDRRGEVPGDLKIGTDGRMVQVIATVDRAGLDRLIHRLEAMKAVLD